MWLYVDERYDGTGPRGLKGEEIPLGSRILAVADEFMELTLKRHPALAPDEALAELEWRAGADFDPKVVEGVKHVFDEDGTAGIRAWASAHTATQAHSFKDKNAA